MSCLLYKNDKTNGIQNLFMLKVQLIYVFFTVIRLFPLAATHSSHVPATLSRSDTLSRSVTAKPFPAPQPSPAPSPEFLYKIHSLIRRFAVLPCNCIPFPILRQSSRHLYVENRLCLQIHCLISSIFYCFICLYLL